MKTHQIHGTISLGLMSIAGAIAVVVMFLTSWGLGISYIILCIVGCMAVLYGFCAKCSAKENCGHVLPGKLAMNFSRKPGAYTPVELGVLLVAFMLMFGLPQFWLWRYSKLLIAFWGLSAIAFFQIRLTMCQVCDNVYCPVNKQKAQ